VVSTTGTSVVINDGNPAPTVVVEGTPSGAGSSQLKLNNDGSAILGGGALTISNAGVVAGASIAGTEITGTVASATNATNLTGGSLTSTGAASLDGGTITTNGAGTISKVVEILWSAALSSGTKLMDLMQSYGFFSDNVGTGLGTTRTWLDGPDRGETHIGPRGSAWFDWIRLRATRVTVALGALSSPNALVFEVTGGPTHLDNAAITTDGSGNLTLGGKVASLGGIATAGSFGVPSIVAQALNVSVTDNASHTILSYTPAANGLYRANLYISNSDSSNPAVTASLVWKDVPFATLKDCQFAANPVFGGNLSVVLNGNTGISSGVMIACMPLVVYAAAGTAIQILYQVPAGTPSDRVTALLEHLA
jgi:hypothetical protein